MRSVVDRYVADGFVARQGVRLIAAYGEGGFWARQWLLARALFAYVTILTTSPVELVHVHAAMRGSFWRKAIFAAIARRFGVPVVLHLHGSEMKDFYAAQPTPVKRLIVGQLEAILRALNDDEQCADVLQRLAAARGAINSLMAELMEDHIRNHMPKNSKSSEEAVDDLIGIVRTYLK